MSDLSPDELALLQSLFGLVRAGDAEAVATYLDSGVPVNLTNSQGDTLLILAAYHRHAAVVRALLDRGADTGRVNDRGQTALAAAVFRQDRPIVEALLQAGADPHHGERSAVSVADFFDLPEMRALLQP